MSTRCQIIVAGHDAIIYRHSDGYPNGEHGVLASLVPLVKTFMEYRGADPFYLTAHIVADQIRRHIDACDKRDALEGGFKSDYRFLGFGVEAYNDVLHGDIEYLYVVSLDSGVVSVCKPTAKFDQNPSFINTEVVQVVSFDGEDLTDSIEIV